MRRTALILLVLAGFALAGCAATPKGVQKQQELVYGALADSLSDLREAQKISDTDWDRVVVLLETGDAYLDAIDEARKAGDTVKVEMYLALLQDTIRKLRPFEARAQRKVMYGPVRSADEPRTYSVTGDHRGQPRPEHRADGRGAGGAESGPEGEVGAG